MKVSPDVYLIWAVILLFLLVLQKPIGIIALLDEAWYSLISLLYSLHHYHILLLVSCPWPYCSMHAACFPNQPMRHSRPSCSIIFRHIQDWRRLSFHVQILVFVIMLARCVLCTNCLEIVFSFSCNSLLPCMFVLVDYLRLISGHVSNRNVPRQKPWLHCCGTL